MTPEPRAMRSALVTGAAGFVGAALARRLAAQGIAVKALVRDAARARRLDGADLVRVQGDLTDAASLARAVEGVDTVFHCAALVTGDPRPAADFEAVNVTGTRDLLEAAIRAGTVKRFVHVSSVAVYGHHAVRGAITRETDATHPETPYGATKLASEALVLAAPSRGLEAVVVRPMWVFGPGAPGAMRLFELVARGRMVTIGGARNAIQPIAVEDLVEGLVACATVPGVSGEVFHMAGPRAITTGEFCAHIAHALGVAPPTRDIPMPVARVLAWGCERFYPRALGKPPLNREKLGIFVNEHAYAIDKAREKLGWQPRVAFDDGARAVARFMAREAAA
jgi:nucleoside-diphosphate-sugar epimerase